MRDVVLWWKSRTSQLLVLFTFALLLVWQNLEVRRADRQYKRIVAEVRDSFRMQEVTRQLQFARLLKSLEDRLSLIDDAIAAVPMPPDTVTANQTKKLGQL